ncbi:putative colanic acid biosynthesis acetyltransferase WcaF [Paraburkholderia caribensis]|nr:putative colanic acid biosynthesis acetyltransferase WcaF [Paraburkholderia caribensis]
MDNSITSAMERSADSRGAGSRAASMNDPHAAPHTPPSASGRVIDLSLAGKGNYVASRGFLIELIWFFIEACVINNKLLPVSSVRVALLRLFGAKIGANCRFVHPVRVKAPWNLTVGDNCWFGVDVWLYNQAPIHIGSNVCISQGSFLSAGSHEMRTNMDLRVAPIVVEDGAWISSKCVVQMGVTIGRSAVVTPLSVVHRSLDAEGVYGGNPCRFIRKRFDADVGRPS